MKKPHQKVENPIFMVFLYVLFTLFTLLCVFPFYYLFINTISDNDLVTKGLVTLVPRGFHLNNYKEVLGLQGLSQAALVSIMRTVLGTVLSVVCTAFMGYALSKKELWGRKFWYRFVVVTMYFNAGTIPWYLNMRNLHLINNFWAYIIPGIISAYNLILVKTYVESLPASLEESAELDGGGYLVIFSRIIFPLCTPILATIAVFTAVGQWNNFTDTLYLIQDTKLYTLQYLLYRYLNQTNAIAEAMRQAAQSGATIVPPQQILTPTCIRMTITIIVSLPVILVYPFFQRFFVKGIMIGAVKG